MTRALTALLFVGLLGACDTVTGFRWRMAIDRADVASTPTFQLARVRRVAEPAPAAIRVAVAGESVAVDNIAMLRHYRVGRDEALFELGEIDGLIVTESGLSTVPGEHGFMLDQVFAAAQNVGELGRKLGRVTDAGQLPWTAELWVEPGVPFSTLVRVIYSLGQANYGDLSFVVEGGAIPVANPLRRCPGISTGKICVSPDIRVGTDGITLVAGEGTTDGCALRLLDLSSSATRSALAGLKGVGLAGGKTPPARTRAPKPPPTPPLPRWAGKLVLPSGVATCPSVPHRDGRVDVAALATFLEQLQAIAPGCKRSVVSAEQAVIWSDLARVLGVVIVERELDGTMLSPGYSETPPCEEAVSVDALGE